MQWAQISKISYSPRFKKNLSHKLKRKKAAIELVMRGKVQELRVSLQNRLEVLNEGTYVTVDTVKDNITSMMKECATEVGGTVTRHGTGKLSEEMKNLIKRQ